MSLILRQGPRDVSVLRIGETDLLNPNGWYVPISKRHLSR